MCREERPMRHFNSVKQKFATKRVMIVEHPRDARYREGIVCYYYLDREDGPADSAEFFDEWPVADIKAHFESEYAFPANGWIEMDDALPGHREDCVRPTPE